MKFSKKLGTLLTPEWRDQYIEYAELKMMLIEVVEKEPADKFDRKSLNERNERFDEEFFQRCESELEKIEVFFSEKLSEATRKHDKLYSELRKHLQKGVSRMSLADFSYFMHKRHLHAFKHAFSELYLALVLLQNYQMLNHTGFRKITKKHDKMLLTDSGVRWFNKYVEKATFHNDHRLSRLIRNTEDIFTYNLEGGNRQQAMKRLRVPPLNVIQHPVTTFMTGYYIGIFTVLLVLIGMSIYGKRETYEECAICVKLHRGPFLMVAFMFLIGINIQGWRRFGVNHVLIFELDPRDNLVALQVLELAAFIAVLWAFNVLGFIHWQHLNIPPNVFPLTFLIALMLLLINPVKMCFYTSRMWLCRLIGRVICAPFYPVGFADFWIGDQMNSLVQCLVDFVYMVVFYCTNWNWYNKEEIDDSLLVKVDHLVSPIVHCLPAWFRFAQCLRRYRDTRLVFPFIVNAGKYASSFPMVYFETQMNLNQRKHQVVYENPYFWFYLVSHIIQTLYCLAWDLLRDFGLFKKCSGENIFLRDHIVYSASFYYFAIIENTILRFFWIPIFFSIQRNVLTSTTGVTISSMLEVVRRYIWNYIRLENEHLFNVGRFRAVRDIYVEPMKEAEKREIEEMMDEPEGVTNRRASEVGFK